MKIFASNTVVAKSRFWFFVGQIKRVKNTSGQIMSVRQIFEKNPNTAKNYGVWIRYDSRSGTHNMYREYRDVTVDGAIEQMYADMAGRHRARRSSIQIIRSAIVDAKDTRRVGAQAFHKSNLKFRMLHRVPRPSHKRYKTTFKASAPNTFF
jgi:large subunit ribosomal protein L18Ae